MVAWLLVLGSFALGPNILSLGALVYLSIRGRR